MSPRVAVMPSSVLCWGTVITGSWSKLTSSWRRRLKPVGGSRTITSGVRGYLRTVAKSTRFCLQSEEIGVIAQRLATAFDVVDPVDLASANCASQMHCKCRMPKSQAEMTEVFSSTQRLANAILALQGVQRLLVVRPLDRGGKTTQHFPGEFIRRHIRRASLGNLCIRVKGAVAGRGHRNVEKIPAWIVLGAQLQRVKVILARGSARDNGETPVVGQTRTHNRSKSIRMQKRILV